MLPRLPGYIKTNGVISVNGRLPKKHHDAVSVVLSIGRRRLVTEPSPKGAYDFLFTSRRRILWARISSVNATGKTRSLRQILIVHRPGPPSYLAKADSTPNALNALSAVFDLSHYLAQLPAASRRSAKAAPIQHYLDTGRTLGCSPHPWFDAAWYASRYPEVIAGGRDPLIHYATHGWTLDYHPHPGFDNNHYLANHPELMLSGPCPLTHWSMSTVKFAHRSVRSVAEDAPGYYRGNRPYTHTSPALMRARRDDYLRLRKVKNRIAFCTSIIGDYDTLRLPEHLSPEVDYHLFTDQPLHGYGVFNVHQIQPHHAYDKTRSARYLKLHLYTLLPDYDVIIYADANVMVKGNLAVIACNFAGTEAPVAFVPHPARKCLYEEAVACFAAQRDTAERIVPQMSAYRLDAFPSDQGLIEGNLFALRPNQPAATRFFSAWWEELEKGSRRDQLSANYVIWKQCLQHVALLGPGLNTRNHPSFALLPHGTHDAPAFAGLTQQTSIAT